MSTQWLPPAPANEPPPPPPPSAQAAHPAPDRDGRSLLRRLVAPLIMIGALLLKFGKAALLILPKAKVLTTSASMLVSVGAYSFIWGWKFALGFVLLLLVHEMGHVIQLRREGIPASAPMFIPFLGAAIMAKSMGDDATAEARVGLAGPVLGTLGALAIIPIAAATGDDFWYALAFTGLFLNLFNLLPVVPLDGGRAMAALSPWMWFVGLFAMAVLAFTYPNPIILLILLLGAFETYRRWKARRAGGDTVNAYYRVKPVHRLIIGGVYLALIAICVLGMGLTFVERDFGDV
ncbi:MAG: site-2 protease family protein [Solirubrobacterales bacterium]|nr:site-2 protease family protein [Solirubrobacterales bacterium]